MPEEMRSAPLLEESIRSIQELTGEIAQTVTELPETSFAGNPPRTSGP